MTNWEKKIGLEHLLKILPQEELDILTKNTFCSNCSNTKIIKFEDSIFINDLYDTILKGKCKKCGQKVNRYVETGEHKNKVELLKIFLHSTKQSSRNQIQEPLGHVQSGEPEFILI